VHGEELTKLAQSAEAAERGGDLTLALTSWRRAIELLPSGTSQRSVIQKRMESLSARIDGRSPSAETPAKRTASGRAAAGLGAVGLLLLKAKTLLLALLANGKLLLLGLTKIPTLLSMLVYVSWWGGGRGNLVLALGVVACIYVHEMGHVAALRRYGIEGSAPMFIPGFGALVRLKQYPTDAHEEARTGLAGPLWGLAAAVVAAVIGLASGSPTAKAVASIAATINLFNLIPVWQLDGARGLRALARNERLILAAVGGVTAIAFHQWMPVLVSGVVLLRAFSPSAHATGDRNALLLFAALTVSLAAVAMLPMGAVFDGGGVSR
jgi:Zn-dependent protease